MRKRTPQVPFSLLSFQDIIVSVSGILLLVVLFLALELTNRQPSRPDALLARVKRDLEVTLETLRDEARSLRFQLDNPRGEDKGLADQEHQLGLIRLETIRLNQENRRKAADLASAEAERDRAAEKLASLGAIQAEAEALEAEAAAIEQESERARRLVHLQSRSGWRVELLGRAIRVVPVGIPEEPPTFAEADQPLLQPGTDALQTSFHRWLDGVDPSTYLLLVVRPSGIARFDVIADRLDSRGHRYGFEPLGEDQELADPEPIEDSL